MRDERTALVDVVESFFIHRNDLSAATAANYRIAIAQFVRWCGASLGRPPTISDLEGGTVEAYLHFRRVTVSAQSARSGWVALRSLAKFLAERRIHHDNGDSVLRLVRQPKVKDEPRRALTDEEMWRVLEVSATGEMGLRDKALVWTLLGCGLRRAEAANLRFSDVKVHDRTLHVRAQTSKSVHPRDVTIPIETAKVLDEYLDQREGEIDADAPFFVDRHGRALSGNGIRKLFERLKVRSGIRDLCAHINRPTWATNFHRSGSGSRFDLMVEGGWTTGRMVERYTKARPVEERRRAPSPFTASRSARKEKRPLEKRPSHQISGLFGKRTA
ncbi:MAG TPA: tyrosine-type recombinase/integrase [Candidatus Limnocylindria bacterium]